MVFDLCYGGDTVALSNWLSRTVASSQQKSLADSGPLKTYSHEVDPVVPLNSTLCINMETVKPLGGLEYCRVRTAD